MVRWFLTIAIWGLIPPSAFAGHLETAIADYVAEKVSAISGLEGAHAEIINIPAAFPDGDQLSITLESSLDKGQWVGDRCIVRTTVQNDRGERRTLGVPVKLSLAAPVWVVTRPVSPGENLKTALRKEVRDIAANWQTAFTTDPAGYTARVRMMPGEILDSRKLKRQPAVQRQHPVQISITNGQDVTITMIGEALEDGQPGQSIRVKNQRKTYTARVVGPNRVEVGI
jgi:flagella basal body P-ring formation protein FlgA